MAFHVACPITCRRICYCTLGFPRALKSEVEKDAYLEEVARVEKLLKDPWRRRASDGQTVQVKVPKVVVVSAPPPLQLSPDSLPRPQLSKQGDGGGDADVDEAALANASAQAKRIALQKKAAEASVAAEDFARRFEAGDLEGSGKDVAAEEQGQSNVKIMCRLCFSGEDEGSERARKLLPCNSCGKKYHRNCLKAWARNRDLFHWGSWACPSCRICEVCRRTGDPNKFMFCRRCDAAYHCYCQLPPHKNVSSGPYLCPKHTRCHSCDSTVPGNGSSLRWFLGYTCCDACGRLFMKGNYCPVCLKVYRDSESTPMVCCDICHRWVHCPCDGISDEKYLQFQVDGNLQYECPPCRGECDQVRNHEEAVQELWKRKDEAERDLIASLRAAVGLPTQDDIFSVTPFSDDEENGPATLKNEYGHSLKFSVKGMVDKSSKKGKGYAKKSSKKKYGKEKGHQTSLIGKTDGPQNFEAHKGFPLSGYSSGDKNEELHSYRSGEPDSSYSLSARSLNEWICSGNQARPLKQKFIHEVTESNRIRTSRTVQINSNRTHGVNSAEEIGDPAVISKTAKGPKIVIHLGGRSKSLTSAPRSDASSRQQEPDWTATNGDEVDHTGQLKGSKIKGEHGHLVKIWEQNSEVCDKTSNFGGSRFDDGNTVAIRTGAEVTESRGNEVSSVKYVQGWPSSSADSDDGGCHSPPASNSLLKESRPLLKLKFKNTRQENQNSWITPKGEEKCLPKGQRSKRKRPSPLREKASSKGIKDTSQWLHDSTMDENWILLKLGKDAVGKKVEVHQPSDNSWHRGSVVEVFGGTSVISVALDDGKARNVELGKQGIRFVSQKQTH